MILVLKNESFPPVENFFNDLDNTAFTPNDYNFAFNVKRNLNMKTSMITLFFKNLTDTLRPAEIMILYKK